MRKMVTALVLVIASLLSTLTAEAHCEECPFPLARMFGEWDTTDSRLVLHVNELRETKQDVLIEVQLRRRVDGTVVARGRTSAPKNSDAIQIRMIDRTGKAQAFYLQLENQTGDLVMSMSPQLVIEPRCERYRRCIRWRPVLTEELRPRPVSTVLSRAQRRF